MAQSPLTNNPPPPQEGKKSATRAKLMIGTTEVMMRRTAGHAVPRCGVTNRDGRGAPLLAPPMAILVMTLLRPSAASALTVARLILFPKGSPPDSETMPTGVGADPVA